MVIVIKYVGAIKRLKESAFMNLHNELELLYSNKIFSKIKQV